MKTYKILVPLDGSGLSRQIVGYVQRLFRPADCELIILRVTEPPDGLLAVRLTHSFSILSTVVAIRRVSAPGLSRSFRMSGWPTSAVTTWISGTA